MTPEGLADINMVYQHNPFFNGPCNTHAQADSFDEAKHEAHVALAKRGSRAHKATRRSCRQQGRLWPTILFEVTHGRHHPLGIRRNVIQPY